MNGAMIIKEIERLFLLKKFILNVSATILKNKAICIFLHWFTK